MFFFEKFFIKFILSKNNLSLGCVSVGIERFFSPVDAADFRRLAVARKNHPTKTIFDNSWPIHGNLCLKKTDWLVQEYHIRDTRNTWRKKFYEFILHHLRTKLHFPLCQRVSCFGVCSGFLR